MLRLILGCSVLALISVGCDDQNQNSFQAFNQTPVQKKPVVTVLPVIDNTNSDCAWSLSDELTSTLYHRLSGQNRLALLSGSEVRAKMKNLSEKSNPFGSDISWIKKSFQNDEFVVFLELVEHEELINQYRDKPSNPENCNAKLNMVMRIRIFDLRGQEPKVILQELVHDSHFIPRQFTQVNFYQVPWGDESFNISPIGFAHAEFAKEIASRVENYILISHKGP